MTTIIHISDTHFGTELPEVVEAARAAIHEAKPDVIVLSGDITQRARHEQFLAARIFLESLPAVPSVVIPGNHDMPLYAVWERALRPYRRFERVFGERERFWRGRDVCVLGLDSTSRWRHTLGGLNPAKLRDALARARWALGREALLVVAAHQPLHTVKEVDRDERLMGFEETARIMAEAGVDVMLTGHVHMPMCMTTHALFPGLPRDFVLTGAGTAVSWRIRPGAPNQFMLLRCAPKSAEVPLQVVSYLYDAEAKRFSPEEPRHFTCEGTGWRPHEKMLAA